MRSEFKITDDNFEEYYKRFGENFIVAQIPTFSDNVLQSDEQENPSIKSSFFNAKQFGNFAINQNDIGTVSVAEAKAGLKEMHNIEKNDITYQQYSR